MRAMLKARINKTDRNDARGLAQMMRVGLYRPVHVKIATLASRPDFRDEVNLRHWTDVRWTAALPTNRHSVRLCHRGPTTPIQIFTVFPSNFLTMKPSKRSL